MIENGYALLRTGVGKAGRLRDTCRRGGAFREEVYDLKTARPTTAVAYGAWPSWIAAEITPP